jgi:Holliday junction resolvasome RuvABC endonuclease subunit
VSKPVRILALDFATRTGWAYDPGTGVPEYGVWDLGLYAQSDRRGALYAALADRIWLGHSRQPIDLLAFERAFGQVQRHGIDMRLEMQGVIRAIAHKIGCRLVSYAATSLKKRAVGYGDATKQEMMAGLHRYLLIPATDPDAVDALWVWYLAKQEPLGVDES